MHVLVTRPAEDAEPLKARIEALGCKVSLAPLMEIVPNEIAPDHMDGATALIATSGNATVDLYLNDGAGVFPRLVDIIAAGGVGTLADLNQDGAPDVISGSPFGEFAVHLNAG